MQRKEKEYKNIFIIGAGPIGMYTAIQLNSLGIRATLIEKRAHYTRPGSIDNDIFNKFQDELQEDFKPSNSYHIKDVERNLEEMIKQKGINRIQGSFIKLVPGGIEVETKDSGKTMIPCDLILDASGGNRVVLESFNQIIKVEDAKKDYFTKKSVGENPVKNHFIAYVNMDIDDAEELENENVPLDPLIKSNNLHELISPEQLVILARLREKYNWPHFAHPFFKIMTFKKNKVCLYFEIPENLPKSQRESWLQELIKIRIGREVTITPLKISERYKDHPKPRFIEFLVNPNEISPLYYEGADKNPTIVAIGDCILTPDYRLGHGVLEGIDRANIFISCLQLDEGRVKAIDFKKYNEEMEPSLDKQKEDILDLQDTRREKLIFESDLFHERLSHVESETDRDFILEQKIKDLSDDEKNEITRHYALTLYKKANNLFQTQVLDEKSAIHIPNPDHHIQLQSSFELLKSALKWLPQKNHRSHAVFLTLMNKMAGNTGDYVASLNENTELKSAEKSALTKKYGSFALTIYEAYFPGNNHQEFLTLCQLLINNAKATNDLDAIVTYADKVLQRIPTIEITPEAQKIIIETITNKIDALFKKSGSLEKQTELQPLLAETNRLLDLLNSPVYQTLATQLKFIPLEGQRKILQELLIKKTEVSETDALPTTRLLKS